MQPPLLHLTLKDPLPTTQCGCHMCIFPSGREGRGWDEGGEFDISLGRPKERTALVLVRDVNEANLTSRGP